ncbi:MAG TPA: hypothetical protein PKK05_17500 [Leptospiraceae bacterium]|nr:hypothetical protein [Leptospiraceae bacterium]
MPNSKQFYFRRTARASGWLYSVSFPLYRHINSNIMSTAMIGKQISLLLILSFSFLSAEDHSPSVKELQKILKRKFLSDEDAKSVILKSADKKGRYCDYNFHAEHLEVQGSADNAYLMDTKNRESSAFAYLSVCEGMNKNEFIITERCCPMGPCYKSSLFRKEKNRLKFHKKIEGDAYYITDKKGRTFAAVPDNFMSGIMFYGEIKKDGLHPVFASKANEITVPDEFTYPKEKLQFSKIDLFASPGGTEPFLALTKVAPEKVKILHKEKDFYFISFPAPEEEIQKSSEVFPVKESEDIRYATQLLAWKYLNRKAFAKLLRKTYILYGWVKVPE